MTEVAALEEFDFEKRTQEDDESVFFHVQNMVRTGNSPVKVHTVDTMEAALQRCFYEKMFWKCGTNLQENTHTEVWFQ